MFYQAEVPQAGCDSLSRIVDLGNVSGFENFDRRVLQIPEKLVTSRSDSIVSGLS